jgi:hypothetical protein
MTGRQDLPVRPAIRQCGKFGIRLHLGEALCANSEFQSHTVNNWISGMVDLKVLNADAIEGYRTFKSTTPVR